MSAFYAKYPANPSPVGGATAANQVLEIADLDAIKASTASIDTKLTNPLPVTGPLTDTQLRATAVPVSGTIAVSNPGLTDTQLRASAVPVSMASSPLPSGASTEATLLAFKNKTASAAVTVPFDYQAISYVGASTNIDQVIFKSGGSGGTVVATLTMGYDGSNRLTSVTKT